MYVCSEQGENKGKVVEVKLGEDAKARGTGSEEALKAFQRRKASSGAAAE